MDILATDHKAERLVIISPETSVQDTTQVLERIQAVVGRELGISIVLSTATFPDQAYSFEGLLEIAEKELNPIHLMADPNSFYNCRGEIG